MADASLKPESRTQQTQWEAYKKLLMRFNKKLSLYSRSSGFSLEELFEESLISASALKDVFKPSCPVIDIGSGNGFPGLALAVLFPKTPFRLCERSRQKTEFLRYAVFKMKVKNAEVLSTEGELLKKSFPAALSKGLGFPPVLRVLNHALSVKGSAFLWKTADWRKHWPETDKFSARSFKCYTLRGKKRELIQVQKISQDR